MRFRALAQRIFTRLAFTVALREPDFVIGGRDDPYLRRWWIIPRNPIFNIYLHHFLHSDDDRALHDHPWWNVSFLLQGRYVEHTIQAGGVQRHIEYRAGDFKFRRAKAAHRVELTDGPCWSLFITGPIIRRWGFHCPNGWRHWKDFVDTRDAGAVGRGCGEMPDEAVALAIAKAQARLLELDKDIAAYPGWGAALSVMDAERKGLKSFLRRHQVTDDPLTARSALVNPKSSDFAHDKTPSEHAGSSV